MPATCCPERLHHRDCTSVRLLRFVAFPKSISESLRCNADSIQAGQQASRALRGPAFRSADRLSIPDHSYVVSIRTRAQDAMPPPDRAQLRHRAVNDGAGCRRAYETGLAETPCDLVGPGSGSTRRSKHRPDYVSRQHRHDDDRDANYAPNPAAVQLLGRQGLLKGASSPVDDSEPGD